MIEVYYSFKEDVGELGANTNIFMAVFPTAHARVKMYQDGLLPLQRPTCREDVSWANSRTN